MFPRVFWERRPRSGVAVRDRNREKLSKRGENDDRMVGDRNDPVRKEKGAVLERRRIAEETALSGWRRCSEEAHGGVFSGRCWRGGHQLWRQQEEMCNTLSGFQDLV